MYPVICGRKGDDHNSAIPQVALKLRAAARDADAKGTTITRKIPQVALKFRAAARDADAKGTTRFGQKKVEI